ncbi:MAG: hypothetical protein Q9162_001453 [Coniocarpon cinnabarinum]
MEASSLVNAHQASRSAFASAKDSTEARRHHEDAATQYAKAASGTEDFEALRILRLLEQQHKQLSTIVKSAADRPRLAAEDAAAVITVNKDEKTPGKGQQRDDGMKPKDVARTSSPPTQRQTSRDMRTSIASNLATARGIPSLQQRTSGLSQEASNADHQSARESLRKNMSNERSPPSPEQVSRKVSNQQGLSSPATDPNATAEKASTTPAPSDYAFNKFYSSVEGIFSALSAPLAYAGLPLTQQSSSTDQPSSTKIPSQASQKQTPPRTTPHHPDPKTSPITSTTPDLTHIFSRAALAAVQDTPQAPPTIPLQDSFTIVPTSGGTISYAKMLSHEERRARASLSHEDTTTSHDAFVDAPEHPSKSSHRHGASTAKSPKLGKTFEELETENSTLKGVINEYSKKLYMWQTSSQRQTQELQASVRLEKQRNRRGEGSSEKGRGKVDEAKLKELEEKVKKLEGECERLGKENEKLKGVVGRYRQRWEELKEGARLRRESPRGGD